MEDSAQNIPNVPIAGGVSSSSNVAPVPQTPLPEVQTPVASPPPPPPSEPPKKKSHKRIILFGIVIVLLVLSAIFAFFLMSGKKDNATSMSESKKTGLTKFTIGYTIWPGYVGMYIARDKGFFKEEGLDVTTKLYPGFDALATDYKKGVIPATADVTLDAVKEAYDGFDHKVVLAVDYSNGSDGIIAGPGITKFVDIKGKKVAYEQGTLEEFFFRYALKQNNMNLEDVIPVNLDAEKAAQALSKGEVDVAVTYEPFLTKTAEEINGKKIFTSAAVPGLITDIISFNSDFIKNNPDTVQAFVRAYFKGVTFWKEHPDEANAIIAKELGVTKEEAVVQLKGINILDKNDNRVAFTFDSGLQSLYGNMREIGRFVESIQKPSASSLQINTDSLIDSDFIKNLSD